MCSAAVAETEKETYVRRRFLITPTERLATAPTISSDSVAGSGIAVEAPSSAAVTSSFLKMRGRSLPRSVTTTAQSTRLWYFI